MPDGATLSDYLPLVSSGDILSLAPGGTYTIGAGATAISGLPAGTATRKTTIQGNGATISGGQIGISTTANYISIDNINLVDQTEYGIYANGANDLSITSVNFSNGTGGARDGFKLVNVDRCAVTGCTLVSTAPSSITSFDGVEFWGPCNDCTVTNTISHGFDNGDDGHGYEVYGQLAGEICDNIQFINCEAYGNQIGFTCEGGPLSLEHTNIVCNGTSSHDNGVYGYAGLQGATLYRTNVTGDNSGNGTAEVNGAVTDI